MHKYILYTTKDGTQGSDGQVNLRLEVTRDTVPLHLCDFVGGTAELYDGYSTYTTYFDIEPTDYDKRRLCLVNVDREPIILSPEFIRLHSYGDNQLSQVNLKLNQSLSDFFITNSNWSLS